MSKIPQTDSVTELARFWDTHDVTEFEDGLEEVGESVFDREDRTVMRVRLQPEEAEALRRLARSKGVKDAELVAEWVSEKLKAS
jgi:hypothetical protein